MTSATTVRARELMLSHGFDARIANLVTVDAVPNYDGSNTLRGNLVLGFDTVRKGRPFRSEIAAINTATVDRAMAIVADPSEIGRLLIAAMRTLPADLRAIEMPAFMATLEDDTRAMLDRAGKLADQAARSGRTAISAPSATDASAPF